MKAENPRVEILRKMRPGDKPVKITFGDGKQCRGFSATVHRLNVCELEPQGRFIHGSYKLKQAYAIFACFPLEYKQKELRHEVGRFEWKETLKKKSYATQERT